MLGTNLGDRQQNLDKALELICDQLGEIVEKSSIFESEAWGYHDANKYYNQAIYIQTKLDPIGVLEACLLIEEKLGRVRTLTQYEARTLDIDVLFYDNLIVESKNLILPHPRISERKFVLEPLCEIGATVVHPVVKKTIQTLLKECPDNSWVQKIN
jgi:2-amino-4-hydroxy-6-hydroxymethyldihydropteridine diphosphokinase